MADPEQTDRLLDQLLGQLVQARPLLDDTAVTPFAVATARTLVGQVNHSIDLDAGHTGQEDAVERRSVTEAYDRLGPDGQVALAGDGPAASRSVAPSLIDRHDPFPEPACRPVLLALATGDRPAQRRLDAGRHLLDCERCAALSQPLLTASTSRPPPAAAHRRRLGIAALAALVLAALVVLVGLGLLRSTDGDDEAAPSSTTTTAEGAATTTSPVAVGPDEVARLASGSTLADYVGQRVRVEAVEVQAVAADEGFWIGADTVARLWVQLSGEGESDIVVQPGRTVTFTGVVTRNGEDMPAEVGLDQAEGASGLERQGAHLLVAAEDVELSPSQG